MKDTDETFQPGRSSGLKPPVFSHTVMPEKKVEKMKAIKNPLVILNLFILFKIVQAVYAFTVGENPSYLSYLRFVGIFIFIPISYLAIRRKVAALWIMGVILLSQIFAVLWAIFLIPLELVIFKVFAVVLSTYFAFGGYVLVQLSRRKNEDEGSTRSTGITRRVER
jgi:hypothetical protein